jgi:hypothetical protein
MKFGPQRIATAVNALCLRSGKRRQTELPWSVTDAALELLKVNVPSGLRAGLTHSIAMYWSAEYRACLIKYFGAPTRGAACLYYAGIALPAFEHFCTTVYFQGKIQKYVKRMVERGALAAADAQQVLAYVAKAYPQ